MHDAFPGPIRGLGDATIDGVTRAQTKRGLQKLNKLFGGHFSGSAHKLPVLSSPSAAVIVAPGSDREKALALHETIHKNCFIARSVNFPVSHSAVIEIAAAG
jgi:hypothetical protein